MTQGEINQLLNGLTNEELIQIADKACKKSTRNARLGMDGAEEISVYSDKKIRRVVKKALVGAVAAMLIAGSCGYGLHAAVNNITINQEYNDNLEELRNEVNLLMKQNYNFYGVSQTADQMEYGGYNLNFDYNTGALARAALDNADIIDAYLYEIYDLAQGGAKNSTLESVVLNLGYKSIKDYAEQKGILKEDGKIDMKEWKKVGSGEVEARNRLYQDGRGTK